MSDRASFPLSAIVGQEALVEALLINAVAPDVGGVLVRGERGTAKSTAVRALAPLLPPVSVATGQPFAFAPGDLSPTGPIAAGVLTREQAAALVELPLGTTLDRLVGSLDLARALDGAHAFEPGLLARAHQGILYVDEVNLLPDHLVDALLDAAAAGIARVEREAVSAEHSARFLLVGTMNVEEGELRPQLLDRFGLGIDVRTPGDPAVRAEIVRRRLAFEEDPVAFAARFAPEEAALADRIARGRVRLASVVLPERELMRITGACAKLGVDGVRGDIVSARAARALAALEDCAEVTEDHVRRAAALALAHRRRRDPLDGHTPTDDEVQRALDASPDQPDDDPSPPNGGAPRPPSSSTSPANVSPGTGNRSSETRSARGRAQERLDAAVAAAVPAAAVALERKGRGPMGRRARTAGPGAGAIDTRLALPESDDLALVATLRARLLGAGPTDLREHVRAGRESAFLCLVVDASGSMGAQKRLARVKGALGALLRDAYARRDRVGVIAFRDARAELLVPPGAPLEVAAAALSALPTGGTTPLADGLTAAERLIRREKLRDPNRRSIAVVLTDGRVRDPDGAVPSAAHSLGRAADAVHVIDLEEGPARVGLAPQIARAADGDVHTLIGARRAA